jgi:kynurenine formamidase
LGHITHDFYSVHALLKKHFFLSQLISIEPEKQGDDMVITRQQVQDAMAGNRPEALVIRTLPNKLSKKTTNYSHTNPPYLEAEAATYLCELGVLHLLIDLPSVDREEDQGRLAAHRAFWHISSINPVNPDARFQATITELIFVPDAVPDGLYVLNLQVASFENDAAPSRPVLYQIVESE